MDKTREKELKTVKIFYDSFGNTLNVWFDDPQKEYISEETGDEVILNKDRKGQVIGFEKLNFNKTGNILKTLPVEFFLQ